MNKIYFIIAATIGLLTSCTEVIDLELPDPDPVLVVDGFITNQDTVHTVKLSYLDNYFSTTGPDYSFLKDSKVYLVENGNRVDTFIYEVNEEQFELRYQGIVGKEYQVDIILPDGSSYTSASETMYEPVPIDTIWWVENKDADNDPTKSEIEVKIETQEPLGLGDNYQWKTYVNSDYLFLAEDLFFSNDQFVDGQYIFDFTVFGMSKKKYDEYLADSPNGEVIVDIEQLKTSTRYYKYLFLVQQQLLQVGSPFAAPPAEIQGNVYKNGEDNVLALGYFYVASLDKKSVKIEIP